jgi:hypothetical protein
VKTVEESFTAFHRRPPTDAERQMLLRERDALDLKDNDALWRVLIVFGHYERLYEQIPAKIAKASAEVTDNARAAAEVELKAAAARTRAELAKSVAQTAHDIAGRVASASRSKWFTIGVVLACGTFLGISISMFRLGVTVGDSSGRQYGYAKARDEKAAADWANTAEGKLAHSLADAGSLHDLAACSGKGWKEKDHACVPRCERGSVDGWSIPASRGR